MAIRSLTAKRWLVGAASIGAAALMAACGSASDPNADNATPDQAPTATETPAADYETGGAATDGNTVVDVAAGNEDFSILVEAVEAAGLTDALASSEAITLFAPTNEAFEALPEGTLDELLLPENQDVMRQVLTYHVVQQEVPAAAVTTGDVPTVAGPTLALRVDDTTGEVMVNEATVVTPDIAASNGVIHAIDQVIVPPDLAL